jgi:pimeloyl-ACP methyl ester carboxylesterase
MAKVVAAGSLFSVISSRCSKPVRTYRPEFEPDYLEAVMMNRQWVAIAATTALLAVANNANSESNAMRSSTVKVPGAKIYYEMQGSGPLLLMIPGGPADAGAYAGVAHFLADRYTVVAYDPRGNSRSTFDELPKDTSVDVHADDAAHLIEALGKGPAYIFGSSGGAQIGLNLAARYPKLVRKLVAHEPPCAMLLDDPAPTLAGIQLVSDTYKQAGVGPAIAKFMAINGMTNPNSNGAGPPPSAAAAATMTRIQNNFDFFLAHSLFPLSHYRPDVSALQANRTRIVVGVGEETTGQTANRTAVALAGKLGLTRVVFPGDHNGYGPHAEVFAETLTHTLE